MKDELRNMSEESLKNLEEEMRDEASTQEDVLGALDKNEKGLVRQTIGNCVFAMQHDPLLAGVIRRNELTCQTDLLSEMPWNRRGVSMTDTDINNLRLYLENNYQLTAKNNIESAIDIVANENRFHPIRDALNALVWDGTPRIKTALHYFLGAEENQYTAEVMRLHMLAAISRVFDPGCKYDIALCLVGPQGGGKSTFFRFLAIDDRWFSDDLHRFEDARVFEKLHGHWIIELGEMGALVNAKSIEEMKSFITRPKETFRLPYEKHAEDHPRQCVFCGTSNDMKFLPFDRSGNRRFAPVEVNPKLAEVHPMADEQASREYILQMWAEAMVIYRAGGFELTFSDEMEEYARNMQRDFMPEDTERGMVENYIESNNLKRVCVKEIYCKVFGRYVTDEMPNWMSKKITEILRDMGWHDAGSRKFKDYGSQKAWEPDIPETEPGKETELEKEPESEKKTESEKETDSEKEMAPKKEVEPVQESQLTEEFMELDESIKLPF